MYAHLYVILFIFRSPGRIVEALVEDFMALVGSGMLTVTVQNTGHTTADYSVSNSTSILYTTAVQYLILLWVYS